jgi:hypothetical protein
LNLPVGVTSFGSRMTASTTIADSWSLPFHAENQMTKNSGLKCEETMAATRGSGVPAGAPAARI